MRPFDASARPHVTRYRATHAELVPWGAARMLVSLLALAAVPAVCIAQAVDDVAGLREALRRADSTAALLGAQLRARDERVLAMTDAVRRGVHGTLVVMLRSDPSAPSTLATATLSVDEVEITTRTYDTGTRQALAAGGADELYRRGQLALPHTISLRIARDSGRETRSLTVTPPADDGTIYVGFVVRADRLDVDSWKAGPAPAEP